MNVLILGDGPEELSWAYALRDHPQHRIVAACPGFKAMPDLPGGTDLDAALAMAGIDAVICGGSEVLRAEGLRRAASTGMRAIALHPPGPNADPYYQVALSRQENGAIVVPDMPSRLHPAIVSLWKVFHSVDLGAGRSVSYEATVEPTDGDLRLTVLPRMLDVVRLFVGEVQAVTATGVPSAERPTTRLTVHLRGDHDDHADLVLSVGTNPHALLKVSGVEGTLSFAHDLDFLGASRLIATSDRDGETITELGIWNAKEAILRVLDEARPDQEPEPGLNDGTRAMEVAEAAARSLRKGRTIDLHYEEMSEVGNFKSVMTSWGCGLILMAMVLMFIAAAADGLGFEKATYIVWIIPPALVIFTLVQLLRFAIKGPSISSNPPPSPRHL